MPCHQRKLALKEKAYIEQNRKEIDLYAGVTDPVEILQIMHKPRKPNPLEIVLPYPQTAQELYHQLTENEQERLETYAMERMEDGDRDQAETILLSLTCFTNARIDRGIEMFFKSGVYYPAILYKNAGAAIRDKLIHLVEHDSANRNHLLLALAWTYDEEVARLFAKWEQHPPSWVSELHVPPQTYAHEAGWELDTDGGKRLLFYPECYHFRVVGREGAGRAASRAVEALQTGDQACPWCGHELTVLFNCDLQDPLVGFMKLSGQRLRVAACMHCNCYGTVFMKVDLEGNYAWSEYNVVPGYLPEREEVPDEWAWHPMELSALPMGIYESAHWTLEAPASQIGGHPAWIQDADYPACPGCSETMGFIAQMDMEQAEDSEGIYYAFLCKTCLITAVNYQQT